MLRSGAVAASVIAAWLSFSPPAHADFDDQPFALRLFFTVDRQSNYASTLARQASMAALDGGSANPGAASWRERPEQATTVTTNFVYAPSTGGREVYAAPVTLRWQAPGRGTIALGYAFTDTSDAGGDNGLRQSLRSDEWIGGYGRRIDDRSAVGFTVRLTSGKIFSDSYAPALGGATVRASTRFLTPEVNVGYATQWNARVSLGAAASYGRARADTTVTNLVPLGLSLPMIGMVTLPPGTVLDRPDDIISMYALRAGAGVQLSDRTALYVDAIGYRLSPQHAGAHDIGRFAFGAEHAADHGFVLRGGIGFDTIGQVNVSAGLGYRPTPTFEAQLALQSNAAPEVNSELGRTRLIAGSIAWIF